MLDTLTPETFDPLTGSRFQIPSTRSGPLDLVLEQVERSEPRKDGPGRAQPFSLVFSSDSDQHLSQAIYSIDHPDLETLDLFLVPIGPNKQSGLMEYEAVFT